MKRVVSEMTVIVMLLVAVAPTFSRNDNQRVNDGSRGTSMSAKRMPFSLQGHATDDP